VSDPLYFQVLPGGSMPSVAGLSPFCAIVIVEADVTREWQWAVSQWLVRSGCLYMMAWGIDCGSWDDSVDWASLEEFDYADIPDDKFVMTTWHRNDTLSETFDFCKRHMKHRSVALETTILLHISSENREQEFRRMYSEA
jgi:hypothetical protein